MQVTFVQLCRRMCRALSYPANCPANADTEHACHVTRTPCPGTSFPSYTPYKTSKYLCCKLHRNGVWSPHFNSVNQPYHIRSLLELLLPTTQLSMVQNVESPLLIHVVQPYLMPYPGPQLPITQAPTTLNTEASLVPHFALPLVLVNYKYDELCHLNSDKMKLAKEASMHTNIKSHVTVTSSSSSGARMPEQVPLGLWTTTYQISPDNSKIVESKRNSRVTHTRM